ncbi:hypothetical protein N802_10255 [Knoellia sinensis KCTC 19936]|uniref:Uncharacterized protein n=1 Tax=Knoellia sinensis KCTC 19936 TaxID=1385520 RepID=A0A0A0J121_9MICO|nr:hypothetical protein [Knoellia sinensis]KGN29867.1 hypothetical protein N802_10255 [Knoellia sinensis KCTC 19936]
MIGQALGPIEGNAESVRALASRLTSAAGKLASMNAALVRIKAGATWDSPSGELFEAAVQKSPPILDALIDRHAEAGVALRTFSDELEMAQARATAASDRHEAATKAYFHLEDLVLAARGTPEEVILQERQNDAMGAIVSAERDHAAAWRTFASADRRLALELRRLADDRLDDTALYTALATMDEFAEEASSIPEAGRGLPLINAVSTAGDVAGGISGVALLVLYGEGSWKEVAINTGASGAGVAAQGLKKGALAGSRPMSRLGDGKRAYAGDDITMKQRFVIGTRELLHERYPRLGKKVDPSMPEARMVVPLSDLPPMPSTKGKTMSQKVQVWRGRALVMTQRKVDEAFLDEWRAATAGGSGAQTMFVAGTTLEKTAPTLQQRASEAFREKPDEAKSPTDLSLSACQSKSGGETANSGAC